MPTRIHNLCRLLEDLEVFLLQFRLKRKLFEERDYAREKFHIVRHHKVMDSITSFLQSPTLQIFLQKQEVRDITLGYIKGQNDLPLEFVIFPHAKGDIKASFSITKSRQILTDMVWYIHVLIIASLPEPFLLIVCIVFGFLLLS